MDELELKRIEAMRLSTEYESRLRKKEVKYRDNEVCCWRKNLSVVDPVYVACFLVILLAGALKKKKRKRKTPAKKMFNLYGKTGKLTDLIYADNYDVVSRESMCYSFE